MPEATIKTSLAGRIRNLAHFKNEALTPLFEAVVNSIQAIAETMEPNQGKISVRILRDISQTTLGYESEDHHPITGFEIRDNGIGFDDDNFTSFQTADSVYKISKGGKGVGRFLWLKAFEKVEIDSTFTGEDKKLYQRAINFNIKDGVVQKSLSPSNEHLQETSVRLLGFFEDYRKQKSAFKTQAKIAQRVFEHCLTWFISDLAPQITVMDDRTTDVINLHSDHYADIKDHIVTEDFTVGTEGFRIHHIRLYGTRAQTHRLVYCAHGRDVTSECIATLLGTSVQFDEGSKKFYYSAYVTSAYLDDTVDPTRQGFAIPQHKDLFSGDEVTMDDIHRHSITKTRNHLVAILRAIEQQKSEMISDFVSNESPMLRAVLKYYPTEVMSEIDLNSSQEKMSETLYAYKGRAEYDIKKQSTALLKTQADSIEEIKAEYDRITEQLEDFQKDQLSAFVLSRKMIIDLLDKKLGLNQDGKYHNEDIVHDIIFPRKTDTDTIGYDDHNLWLIDELLSFHTFAVSDKRHCDYSPSTSEGRPDVLVYSEVGEDRFARSVALLEFKKPERNKFDEDPTKQLYRYVRETMSKGIWSNSTGRHISANDQTRFFCYAICDITAEIREFAENGNFAELQGDIGFYNYNRIHNAHVEIISFDKIVLDAKKRHHAFFDKLGIDSMESCLVG